jgi:phasin family protein
MTDNTAKTEPQKAVEAAAETVTTTAEAATEAAKTTVSKTAAAPKKAAKTVNTKPARATRTKAVSSKKPVRRKAAAKPKATSPRKGKTQMATSTKTARDTVETMTAAGNEAFKEGFEKTIKSFNEAGSFHKENLDAVIASATAAGKGAEKLNADTIAFAKKSMEDTVAASKALTSAKSVQEMVEVHTNFVKSSMDAYLAQINTVTDLYAGTVKDTMAPLNARVSAAVEMVQSQR